jgi:hypothetical protein
MLAGAALAALATPAALVALTTAAAAQDATWLGTNSDFNLDTNWNTGSVPFGTAFFGTSSITALSFSADTTIGGWTFNPGVADYTFTNSFMRRRHWDRWWQRDYRKLQSIGLPGRQHGRQREHYEQRRPGISQRQHGRRYEHHE